MKQAQINDVVRVYADNGDFALGRVDAIRNGMAKISVPMAEHKTEGCPIKLEFYRLELPTLEVVIDPAQVEAEERAMPVQSWISADPGYSCNPDAIRKRLQSAQCDLSEEAAEERRRKDRERKRGYYLAPASKYTEYRRLWQRAKKAAMTPEQLKAFKELAVKRSQASKAKALARYHAMSEEEKAECLRKNRAARKRRYLSMTTQERAEYNKQLRKRAG